MQSASPPSPLRSQSLEALKFWGPQRKVLLPTWWSACRDCREFALRQPAVSLFWTTLSQCWQHSQLWGKRHSCAHVIGRSRTAQYSRWMWNKMCEERERECVWRSQLMGLHPLRLVTYIDKDTLPSSLLLWRQR